MKLPPSVVGYYVAEGTEDTIARDQSHPKTSVFTHYFIFFHAFLFDCIQVDFWKFGGRVSKPPISPVPGSLSAYKICRFYSTAY